LDEGFFSKNYVRKFLRALHPKWRAKVMTIEELKDLSSLALDELIGNLKVHEVVMEKDFKIYKGKKRVKSIALKGKKESSDDETLTSRSDDEENAMAVRNFRKFFRRKGCWSVRENESKDKINDETCRMAQSSNDVTLDSSHYSGNASSLDDGGERREIQKVENGPRKQSGGNQQNPFTNTRLSTLQTTLKVL
nr:UBN2 domain-containing protein [Tanacetum cinerariifolium]